MSSCTECHGMAGDKYDDHTSFECPRIRKQAASNTVEDEELRAKLAIIMAAIKAETKSGLYAIEDASNTIVRLIQAREAILKADLAQAIGYCQGLGKPNKYLEKRYPEMNKGTRE